MKTKLKAFHLIVVVLSLCLGFAFQTPFLIIEDKDVALVLPLHFPKPIYKFKQNARNVNVFVLGRKLFYDDLLSKDNTVNCGTCHQRIAAFAHIDHALSHGIYAKIGTRNVPALQNLIWKDAFMWDGRVNDLESQPVNPITNPIEMDETMPSVINKLQKSATYKTLFFKAFQDCVITQDRILKSLAQFTGLMISANSRYDKYLTQKDSFSISEKKGLALFRQKCAVCHKEPLFTDNSYKNNNIAPDTALKDTGREKITGKKNDRYKFKVPGLRNIEMTYPYMHDGRFRNLQAVLKHYGNPNNFNSDADAALKKIGLLTPQEQKDIIALIAYLQRLGTDIHKQPLTVK